MDVGLVSAPDAVLLDDTARIDPTGGMQYESHPERPVQLVAGIPDLEDGADWIRLHYKQTDGS